MDLSTEIHKVTVSQDSGNDLDLPTERYKVSVTQDSGNNLDLPTEIQNDLNLSIEGKSSEGNGTS